MSPPLSPATAPLLLLLAAAAAPAAASLPCTFTRDCLARPGCANLADASCVCNFGACAVVGHWWGRPREAQCSSYTDCPCRSDW